jgi:hypothetical protein
MKLSLRDLFWAVLIAAIAFSWRLEHLRVRESLVSSNQMPWQITDDRPNYTEIAHRPQRMAELGKLGEQELIGRTPYYLHEMARRRMSGQLQEMYDHFKEHAPRDPKDPNAPPSWDNRQLLTALRRAQLRPDPIEIEIVSIGRDAQGKAVRGPLILSRIKNVDEEGEPFHLQSRESFKDPELWRVQLLCARGELMESVDIGAFDAPDGGPVVNGALRSGMSENCDLIDARHYLKAPPPGKYRLVLVHAIRAIANDDDLAGRIVWKSAPVPVVVENLGLTSKWELIRFPLTTIVVVVVGTLGILCRRLLASRPIPKSQSLQIHDWVALAIIVMLAAGWCADILQMKKQMEKSGLDLKTTWTMRLAN